MTSNYEILLMHHNRELVSGVLLHFERSINGRQTRVLQSKSVIEQLITDITVVNNDISRLIVSLMNPSLKILHQTANSCVIYTFGEQFVEFNHASVVDFASYYLQKKRNRISFPLCIIHLFDSNEAYALISGVKRSKNIFNAILDTNVRKVSAFATNYVSITANVYGFYTRFFASIFNDCHHIHLFGDKTYSELSANDVQSSKMSILMKVFSKIVIAGNQQRIWNLAAYSYVKLPHKRRDIVMDDCEIINDIYLIDTLLTSIYGKKPPMKWGLFCERLRLRRNVIREIQSVISPLMLNEQRVMNLLAYVLKQREIRSKCILRTSYV